MLDSLLHTNNVRKSWIVNEHAPFSGRALTFYGKSERTCSVFSSDYQRFQRYWTDMFRFLSRFWAVLRFKSGWIKPLQVGGHAPFSPCRTNEWTSRQRSVIWECQCWTKCTSQRSVTSLWNVSAICNRKVALATVRFVGTHSCATSGTLWPLPWDMYRLTIASRSLSPARDNCALTCQIVKNDMPMSG